VGVFMNSKQQINKPCYANYHVYTAKDASDLFKGRDVYIWGAGQKGRGFRLALERNGFKIKAFLDSSPLLIGTEYQGIPVLDPKIILNDQTILKNSFIFTASVDRKNKEMFELCQNIGLTKGKDFINIQELSPFYPTVEVSGVCNLRCIACPRGNSAHPPRKGGFMTAADYSKIIDKLIREIPFLYLVDLYIWGEPLLNCELPEIIKINTHLGIASGISSNLNAGKHIDAVIKASPAQIRVSISGYGGKNYEITHKGGHWANIYKNLLLLSEYIKKYRTKTIVEVYFHANKNNLSEYKNVSELCTSLGYRIHPSISMIFPDYAMDYVEGKELCEEAQKAKDLMLVSIDEMIDNAKQERKKSCLLKRIIPVINWDMSVQPCCNYSYRKLADNYLEISLTDIINLRNTHPLCIKCQKYSLHRYFNPEYYSDYVNELLIAHRG
jgi:MoaA/NifB/PqqE/SkfB family radical SAM enzyme